MEIKILCACGTKYQFSVEPVNQRMPLAVQCPRCGADGTTEANEILKQGLPLSEAELPPPESIPPAAPPPNWPNQHPQ